MHTSAENMPQPDHSPFSLSGRVALVTGSTTGLGKAMAVALNFQNNTARAEKAFAEPDCCRGD